jgi:sulfur carrier protein ThiS
VTSANTTIAVTLNLFGDHRRYQPPGETGPVDVTCRSGATIADLLRQLGIPEDEETAISLNGELGRVSDILKDGDELVLFGPNEGG